MTLPTTSAVTPEDFAALVRRLNAPIPRRIVDWAEFFLPHAPPDSPRWQISSHVTESSIETLMRRLGPQPRHLCGLTAVEMVLHFWHDAQVVELVSEPLISAPMDGRAMAERMLFERVPKPERDRVVTRVRMAGRELITRLPAENSALELANYETAQRFLRPNWPHPEIIDAHGRRAAAGFAAEAVASLLGGSRAMVARSIFQAAHTARAMRVYYQRPIDPADNADADPVREFLVKWWARCQCRLAFADAAKMIFE